MQPTIIMNEKRRREVLKTYHALMNEAKWRIEVTKEILWGLRPLPFFVARETAFLQLRMLCELIALACLAAHGDLIETGRIRKEWRAGKMVAELEELSPAFYPIPLTFQTDATGLVTDMQTNLSGEHLSKEELRDLVGICGDVLHRGHLKKILRSVPPPKNEKFEDYAKDALGWLRKVDVLLRRHKIVLLGEKQGIVCDMEQPMNKGAICAFVEIHMLSTPWPRTE